MHTDISRVPIWRLFIGSVLLSWAILGVGFRVFYDNVTPEVAALVLAGFVLALVDRPQRAWVWVLGLGIGIEISEVLFPAPPPPEHVARYGPPHMSLARSFILWAFPAAGTVVGLALRRVAGWAIG
jgi:hypothetical protein